MRRLVTSVCCVALLAACTSNPSAPTPGSATAATEPIGTVPPPGNCVPGETLPSVTLIVDGKRVVPTFGIGSSECGSLNGRGYIAFDYDPVLVDASKPIEVELDGDATVTFAWPSGAPFTQTSPRHWRSGNPAKGCSRLEMNIASPSGASTETLGADIRVGGPDVECAQRGLGPIEPIDTSVIVTEPLDTILGRPDETDFVDSTVVNSTVP